MCMYVRVNCVQKYVHNMYVCMYVGVCTELHAQDQHMHVRRHGNRVLHAHVRIGFKGQGFFPVFNRMVFSTCTYILSFSQ